jgi:two-component system sensor histidine kinase KdpD
MSRKWNGRLGRSFVVPAVRGCLILAVLTAGAFRFHLNVAVTGFSFLIAIVLNCLNGARASAVVVSVMAVACLDYFFIEPLFSFTVADPIDFAALGAFLTTSLVTTRLASTAREEAAAARREHRNLEQLYAMSQKMLGLDPLLSDPAAILESVRDMLHLRAVSIFDGGAAELQTVGDGAALGDRTRDAYILCKDVNEPESGMALRCLRTGGKASGAIGFLGLTDVDAMAGPVAALTAAAIERGRAARAAANAAAEARTETLRSAILDALAHEFKTPLAAILTATGGLRETGCLGPQEAELAEIVESEADRLSNLTSRLLRLARLDSQEVRPRLENISLVTLVSGVLDRYRSQNPDREFPLAVPAGGAIVAADAELLQLALSQLLDNACRYSPRGSPVRVFVASDERSAQVTVWNAGDLIPASERRLIFERFYRGSEGRQLSSGSGLGLYVARKIALAHDGALELDSSQPAAAGVVFRLSIPIAGEESDLEA